MASSPFLIRAAATLLLVSAGRLVAADSSPASPATPDAAVERSVVQIFVTARYPDPYRPWNKQPPSEKTGTGVVIEGKRILTAAHVVEYAGQVQVQAGEQGDKVSATIEHLAPGIDLAVLKLDDESLFATHPPLPRAKVLPGIKDTVLAYGYPRGSANLSITKGIVSRIDFAPYGSHVQGLRIQIDAAINPGNSGGPVLADGAMIGLAASRLGDAAKIGFITPCEEIELFLADVADGRHDGKPSIYDDFQTLENPALRAYLRLDRGVDGMVISRVLREDPNYPLRAFDVIHKVGDVSVDNEGRVPLTENVRVSFRYLVQKLAKDGRVPLTVAREGKLVPVSLPVSNVRPTLIPPLDGGYPSWFVCGPLVFSEVTSIYLYGLVGNKEASGLMAFLAEARSPLLARLSDPPAFEGERLVVISSPLFPHRLGKGYGNPAGQVIGKLNGVPVKNLAHFVAMLRDSKEEFLVFGLAQRGETMVFNRKEMLAATDEILSDNGVRAQGSPDTLAVWGKKGTAR